MTATGKLQRKLYEGLHEAPASLEQILEERSFQYLQRCSETPPTEERHSVLAKLYAALRRLQEAVAEGRLAEPIFEIGSNLMACEQMAILLAQGDTKNISFMGYVGLSQGQLEALSSNAIQIIERNAEGDVYVKNDANTPDPFLSSLGVTALVPFWQDSMTKGVIVFFDLLPQRSGWDAGDRELLKLLSVYAGPCLLSAKVKEKEEEWLG